MKRISRRNFLKVAGVGAAPMVFAVCTHAVIHMNAASTHFLRIHYSPFRAVHHDRPVLFRDIHYS